MKKIILLLSLLIPAHLIDLQAAHKAIEDASYTDIEKEVIKEVAEEVYFQALHEKIYNEDYAQVLHWRKKTLNSDMTTWHEINTAFTAISKKLEVLQKDDKGFIEEQLIEFYKKLEDLLEFVYTGKKPEGYTRWDSDYFSTIGFLNFSSYSQAVLTWVQRANFLVANEELRKLINNAYAAYRENNKENESLDEQLPLLIAYWMFKDVQLLQWGRYTTSFVHDITRARCFARSDHFASLDRLEEHLYKFLINKSKYVKEISEAWPYTGDKNDVPQIIADYLEYTSAEDPLFINKDALTKVARNLTLSHSPLSYWS